ncbi:phospho-sugar mutase [Symbiobacterium thermophilum]|nr:phospho-sugar mutase [Symbiobacterium thermophilum]
MSTVMERFRLWSEDPYFDEETRRELAGVAGDPREIEDRFYQMLAFGTGGLRGVIGAGTNRINRYMVRLATQGLAEALRATGPDALRRGVVIAHDSRRRSAEFAREAAFTLAANGVVAHLWEGLRPTPMLSFAVRKLGAAAGIVITASHNPPEYNGYKVYWEDGGQVPPDRAGQIQAAMQAVGDIRSIRPMAEGEARTRGLLRPVPPEVDEAYYRRLLGLVSASPTQRHALRILYTPLHGTGLVPVRTVLERAGFPVEVVAEQAEPDPGFPTVAKPNPEEPEVYEIALRRAASGRPDLILATDPDADRLGVLVRDREGGYRALTGNQIGAILAEQILRSRAEAGTLPANGAVIKTIATSNLVASLCREYGVTLLETHTGFKFIGEKIKEFEETGSHEFLFGFEESYGYLAATFVRDKDAVMAALLVADAAAHHKAEGRTLLDALEAIWQRHGYFQEGLHNVTLPGRDGQARIRSLMAALRADPPRAFAGVPVAYRDDYAAGTGVEVATGRTYPLQLGRAEVLHYRFADGGFVMVRPSGTEPKLKVYVSVVGADAADAVALRDRVMADALARMGLSGGAGEPAGERIE